MPERSALPVSVLVIAVISGLPPLHSAFYTAKKVAERLGVARQELHGILPSHSHRFSRWRSSKEKE